MAIGIDLVDENGPMLPPVSLQISLAIAVDVQLPDLATTLDRVLPHGRAHGLAFPFDVARQTDVHREQLRHLDTHRGTFRLAIALTGAGAHRIPSPRCQNRTEGESYLHIRLAVSHTVASLRLSSSME